MTTRNPLPRPEGEPRPVLPRSFVTTFASHPAAASEPARAIKNNRIYVDGEVVAEPESIADARRLLDETPGGMAWIGLFQPDEDDLEELGRVFGLHELAIEDAIQAHQRPKLERYDDTLFVVLRAARYLDAPEEIEFGELHIFTGPNFILTVRHGGSPNLARVRRRMEGDREMLALGPEAVMYAILDAVVDGYAPVLEGLAVDIDEIEAQIFTSDVDATQRIYELNQEVIEFQRAIKPLKAILDALAGGFAKYGVGEELQEYLRDVADHTADAQERVEGVRLTLRDILTVNATLVAQQQNEEMRNLSLASHRQNEEVKKISAWAAILFAPTLVSSIYGMNFKNMPELDWAGGYPMALLLMIGCSFAMWLVFQLKRWI